MNLLNSDVHDYIPDIINAYTKVFGIEYKDSIEKMLNKTMWVMYNNVDGMDSYLDFLKKCKQRELAIKFLEKIGIDIGTAKEKSYAEKFDDDISELINKYIGNYMGMEPELRNSPAGIKAWKSFSKEDWDEELVERQKIKFINFLRGQNASAITKETFQTFCETDEYKQLLEKIEKYLQVYDEISEEYDNYLQEIAPYQKYVDEESKRRNELKNSKINILYAQVEGILPDDIKSFWDEKYSSIDEKNKAFTELGEKTYAEYFSQQDEDKLNDSSVSESDKDTIYYYRTRYFKEMGITIDKEGYDFKNNKEFYEYSIQQEDIRKLILPTELADNINSLRTKAYEEFQRDFICNSKDFIENAKLFDNHSSDKKHIYKHIQKKHVCMASGHNDKGIIPIISFTVRGDDENGKLDYVLLHEICHAILLRDILGIGHITGIDISFFDAKIPRAKNPYNSQKRKYERFNETLTDIFAIKATQVLHEEGIYIYEPQKIIDSNVNDNNTHSIVKNLLTTFLNKYGQTFIKTAFSEHINGLNDIIVEESPGKFAMEDNIEELIMEKKYKELFDIIGKNNFEDLNDVVNKVDSLIGKGLESKLKNNQNEDIVVIEYYQQLERLEQIYENMENYQSKNLPSDDLLKSAISATEEKTRSGQINECVNNITATFNNVKVKNNNGIVNIGRSNNNVTVKNNNGIVNIEGSRNEENSR